jgi:hypothetical protein
MYKHFADAYVIDIDGTEKEVSPSNGRNFTLKELAHHINVEVGYTEFLKTMDGRWLVVDEEGALKPDKRVNVKGRLLYLNGFAVPIYGKVLICKPLMIR